MVKVFTLEGVCGIYMYKVHMEMSEFGEKEYNGLSAQ